MSEPMLLHELLLHSAARSPTSAGIKIAGGGEASYESLAATVERFAAGLVELGVRRGERVAVYMEKRDEFVVACFGSALSGAAFVPVNPLLRPSQVAYILRDCNVRVLVTTADRLATLESELRGCPDLRHVVTTGEKPGAHEGSPLGRHAFHALRESGPPRSFRVIDQDIAAILYTSGSTGQPKGVVLSHRNLVAGAKSVAQYLENSPDDVILAALPLSFDAGFSQLTTGFLVGAKVVLLNYVLAKDLLVAMESERVTGLTAVPPLWIQLCQASWSTAASAALRYFANTGGRLPLSTYQKLRKLAPNARPFLMYGLTEAFRATFLPPEQADKRPDSIGKAIPNAEILVLREDGSPCAPNEPGELVQRGAHVALGYWNDPVRTAERFRVLPRRQGGLMLDEVAVFSGDTVRSDEEGFLYFIGRRDEMIKTSGYRVSPTEIEEVAYQLQGVSECAAFGVDDEQIGQKIALVVFCGVSPLTSEEIVSHFKQRLPAYMIPALIEFERSPLPRNPNGKVDRKQIASKFATGA